MNQAERERRRAVREDVTSDEKLTVADAQELVNAAFIMGLIAGAVVGHVTSWGIERIRVWWEYR